MALIKYLAEERVICTIKQTSVIGALEDIVLIPKTQQEIKWRHKIGSETYKLVKRDDMRILYQISQHEGTNVLIFCLMHRTDRLYTK